MTDPSRPPHRPLSSHDGIESDLPVHLRPTARTPNAKGCVPIVLLCISVLLVVIVPVLFLILDSETLSFPRQPGSETRRPIPDGFKDRLIQVQKPDYQAIRTTLHEVLPAIDATPASRYSDFIDQDELLDEVMDSPYRTWTAGRAEMQSLAGRMEGCPTQFEKIEIAAVKVIQSQPLKVVVCAHVESPGAYYLDVCYWLKKFPDGKWKFYDWMEVDEGTRYSDEVAMVGTPVSQREYSKYESYQAAFDAYSKASENGDNASAVRHLKRTEGAIGDTNLHDLQTLLVAWQYFSLGERDAALRAIQKIRDKSIPGVWFLGALIHHQNDEFEKCLEAALRYLSMVGDSPAMYEILADGYLKRMQFDESLTHRKKQLACVPGDQQMLIDFVRELSIDRLNEMEEPIRQFADQNPESITALRIALVDAFAQPVRIRGRQALSENPLFSGVCKKALQSLTLQDQGRFEEAARLAAVALNDAAQAGDEEFCRMVMQRAIYRAKDHAAAYELCNDKPFYAATVGDYCRNYGIPSVKQNEEVQRKHLQDFPDDLQARYELAVAVGVQGQAEQALADLTRLYEELDEDDMLAYQVEHSISSFRYDLHRFKEILEYAEEPESAFRSFANQAWNQGDQIRLKGLIEAMETHNDASVWLQIARAHLLDLQGDCAAAVKILENVVEERFDESEEASAARSLWVDIAERNFDNATVKRPRLSTELANSIYSDMIWEARPEVVSWFEEWAGENLDPAQRQLNQFEKALEKRDYESVLTLGEAIMSNTGSTLDIHDREGVVVGMAIAEWANGNKQAARKRLGGRRRVEETATWDSHRDRRLALGLLFDFLDGKDVRELADRTTETGRFALSRRFWFYNWMDQLETPVAHVNDFSGLLPPWFSAWQQTDAVYLMMNQPLQASHEAWIAEFLQGSSLQNPECTSMSSLNEYESVTGIRVKTDHGNLIFGFHSRPLIANDSAMRDDARAILEDHQSVVSIHLWNGSEASQAKLMNTPDIESCIQRFVDQNSSLSGVYFDSDSMLIPSDEISNWLQHGMTRPIDERLCVYLYPESGESTAADRIAKQQTLLDLSVQPDALQTGPIEVLVHLRCGLFTEEIWLELLRFEEDESFSMSLICRVKTLSIPNAEYPAGRVIELDTSSVVDWRR